MDVALVVEVLADSGFDGGEAGEDVAVGVDDAFGFGGGAGGEEDLNGSGGLDGVVDVAALGLGQGGVEVVEAEGWDGGGAEGCEELGIGEDEFGFYVFEDAAGEGG